MNRMSFSNHNHEELIPVVYAHDLAEAEYFRSLLTDNDIPAFVDENYISASSKDNPEGVPVMVPEEHLEEAQDIIELHYHLNDDFEDERDAQDEDDDDDEEVFTQLDSDPDDPNVSSEPEEDAGGPPDVDLDESDEDQKWR